MARSIKRLPEHLQIDSALLGSVRGGRAAWEVPPAGAAVERLGRAQGALTRFKDLARRSLKLAHPWRARLAGPRNWRTLRAGVGRADPSLSRRADAHSWIRTRTGALNDQRPRRGPRNLGGSRLLPAGVDFSSPPPSAPLPQLVTKDYTLRDRETNPDPRYASSELSDLQVGDRSGSTKATDLVRCA